VDRYRPLILGFLRRRGLAGDDAEDVAQNALLEFSRAYRDGRYDREKGRLRSWLFGIVYHQLLGHLKKARRRETPASEHSGIDLLGGLEAENTLQQAWDVEWEQTILRQCFSEIRRQVQSQTFQAFEEVALKQRPAGEVARDLGMTENAVYSARRRVTARMREILPLLRDIW